MSLKEDVEVMENRIKELEEENKNLKKDKPNWMEQVALDNCMVKGFCAVNDLSGYKHSKIDIKEFLKVLKAIQAFEISEIVVSVNDNHPILFRSSKKDKIAMVLAPIVDEDMEG